ncbi:MAG: PorT family protein [Tenacibaculum sp.]|nr:PorT family protein [Tenacibaculum sp.]
MKKVILTLCLVIGITTVLNAQVDFGVKAGINYNSDSFVEVKDDIIKGAKSKTGYHAGVWVRANIPVLGLYIRPELVYTSLSNDVTLLKNIFGNKLKATYDFQKIDVPVLVGKKFFGVVHAYAGPSFQYIINGKLNHEKIKEINVDGFTVGAQLGLGVEFGGFGLYVNWERSFTDKESELITKNIGNNDKIKFDTRVNQIIMGVSYKF